MPILDELHQLKHNLVGDEHTEAPSGNKEGREELSHKVKDVLAGSEERKKREEAEEQSRIQEEKEQARRNVDGQRGWASKVHDTLDGGKCKSALEQVEFERLEAQAQEESKKHSDIANKLHDAFEAPSELHHKVHELIHGNEQAASKEVEDGDDHLRHKMKNLLKSALTEDKVEQKEHHRIWESKVSEEQHAGDEGWSEKLRAFSGLPHKAEKKNVDQGWLMEKLNEVPGIRTKKKVPNDKLNQAIDFVQEHVLRQDD